jgi:hypothetical protein
VLLKTKIKILNVQFLNFYHYFQFYKWVKWLFNKKIFLKIPKESFLRIFEVKNNSNYAFYPKPEVNLKSGSKSRFEILNPVLIWIRNPKSGLNPDLNRI